MNTLTIIVVLLAITAATNGFNVERLRRFQANYLKCNEDMGGFLAEPRSDILKCALDKDGRIFNQNGSVIKEQAIKAVEGSILDENKQQQAGSIFTKCYEQAIQDRDAIHDQTMKIIACCLPILSFLNELN